MNIVKLVKLVSQLFSFERRRNSTIWTNSSLYFVKGVVRVTFVTIKVLLLAFEREYILTYHAYLTDPENEPIFTTTVYEDDNSEEADKEDDDAQSRVSASEFEGDLTTIPKQMMFGGKKNGGPFLAPRQATGPS
jgi:hypothetical protein